MDLAKPFESMFPTVDSSVLSVLARTTRPRTGREISRLAARSQAATQRVLDRLVSDGLVLRVDAGRSRVYTLNREHLAAEPIERLVNLRRELFSRLRVAVDRWQIRPVHVSVFGSTARGDATRESDVDIFLIRPGGVGEEDAAWRSQVDVLADSVFEWTGNHAGIAEVSEREVDRLGKERPPVVGSLEADAVEIAGVSVGALFRTDRR